MSPGLTISYDKVPSLIEFPVLGQIHNLQDSSLLPNAAKHVEVLFWELRSIVPQTANTYNRKLELAQRYALTCFNYWKTRWPPHIKFSRAAEDGSMIPTSALSSWRPPEDLVTRTQPVNQTVADSST